jgi:hypothetical protein
MTFLLKGLVACLVVMLFAQAWLTVQALDENRSGSVFALYKEKGFTQNTMIYSTIILMVGTVVLGGAFMMGGKQAYNKRSTLTQSFRTGMAMTPRV